MKSWKLQGDIFQKKDLKEISNFILKSKKFTQGPKVKEFEDKFSKWNNSKFSLYVNSGSTADFLIVNTAKEIFSWKDGDEIIVPSLTWPTQISSVTQNGLKPIFIDCNLNDLSFNYKTIEKNITKKTKAIFLAHIMGFPSNIKTIKKITKKYNLKILEDCCESIGAKYPNKVGNLGVAGSFSFFWGHHMTTIEGGMITTNDYNFYKMCKLKRAHGLAREMERNELNKISKKYPDIDKQYLFLTNGFNFRNTEINALIGINQLKKLNSYIKIRNNNFSLFKKLLEPMKDKVKTVKFEKIRDISSYAFPIFLKNKYLIKKFKKKLTNNNIQYRPIISGNILRQPFLGIKKKMVNSDFVHNNGLYIGNNQFVTKKMIQNLIKLIKEV